MALIIVTLLFEYGACDVFLYIYMRENLYNVEECIFRQQVIIKDEGTLFVYYF